MIKAGGLSVDPEAREKYPVNMEETIRRARTQPGCPDRVLAAYPMAGVEGRRSS